MDGQSVSINQAFRQRIRGYMKAILIFNSCKLAAAIGALVAAIFIKVNCDKYIPTLNPVFYILPSVGAAVVSLLIDKLPSIMSDW